MDMASTTEQHEQELLETQTTLLREIWQCFWYGRRITLGRSIESYGWTFDQIAQDFDDQTGHYFPVMPRVFEDFTDDIKAGLRCPSCATGDPTTMVDDGETVCAECGGVR